MLNVKDTKPNKVIDLFTYFITLLLNPYTSFLAHRPNSIEEGVESLTLL